jgi:opacity protein-like surface antigen
MSLQLKPGLAALAVGLTTIAAPAVADGMHRSGGSIKDAPAPVESRSRACYFRADAGYAWSAGDEARGAAYGAAVGPITQRSFDDGWFGEIGVGCGWGRSTVTGGSIKDAPVEVVSGPGIRADVTVGFRGDRTLKGEPPLPPPAPTIPDKDPVHGKVSSITLMFNGYLDLGNFHGFTPYVGAGIGVAFNELDNVTFTNGTVVRLGSRRESDFAWALMAGVARDLGRGVMLDIGYRYIDLGEIGVAGVDGAGRAFSLHIDDLAAHEIRIGIRVPFGH